MSGCSSCGNTVYSPSGACSSCGGDCGQPKKIVTTSGLPGEDGRGYDATSSTSTDVLDTAAVSVVGVITIEKAYTPGARVRFSDTAAPSANYFEGIVTAYDPLTGAMTVDFIDLKVGAGTIASWDVNLAGEQGKNPDYFFEVTQTIDFLDTYLIENVNTNPLRTIGVVVILPTVAGTNKSYAIGTPVKITPTSERGNVGTDILPVPKIEGVVQGYDPQIGVLQINVLAIQGTGTYGAWDVDLNYVIPTVKYLNGILLPPSAAGSSHGGIVIPGNTFFDYSQTLKINLAGRLTPDAVNPMEVYWDGVTLFSKILTSTDYFELEITVNTGYYVTISAVMRTGTGVDDHRQQLGIDSPAPAGFLLSTYRNQTIKSNTTGII